MCYRHATASTLTSLLTSIIVLGVSALRITTSNHVLNQTADLIAYWLISIIACL